MTFVSVIQALVKPRSDSRSYIVLTTPCGFGDLLHDGLDIRIGRTRRRSGRLVGTSGTEDRKQICGQRTPRSAIGYCVSPTTGFEGQSLDRDERFGKRNGARAIVRSSSNTSEHANAGRRPQELADARRGKTLT